VLVVGHTAGRATRWFNIFGLFMFQPTEFAKIAFVIYLAHVTAAKAKSLNSLARGYLPPLAVAAVLMAAALAEPDFGTAIMFGILVVTLLFVAGTRLAYVAFTFAFLIPSAAYLVYQNSMRFQRVMAFLDPWAHRYDTAYATVNSLAAMATGGLTGVGLGRGQQKIGYIPEAQTDFILSVVGEELGLLGTMFIIALYIVIIVRGLRAARAAPDSFAQTLGFGLVFLLTVQVFINVGVAYALLPTKGLTLPLVSYGGTSMVMTCFAMGILLHLSRCGGDRRHVSKRRAKVENSGAVPLKFSGERT
jgi:cell division protein FtsW